MLWKCMEAYNQIQGNALSNKFVVPHLSKERNENSNTFSQTQGVDVSYNHDEVITFSRITDPFWVESIGGHWFPSQSLNIFAHDTTTQLPIEFRWKIATWIGYWMVEDDTNSDCF